MCCLFGILDYKKNLTIRQRQTILKVLSAECEERGTDATGIACYVGDHLYIQKAPRPAHKMRFRLFNQARYIMGHTRMSTQGSEKFNFNNHPFDGHIGSNSFALAHNGVLHNEDELRAKYNLPPAKIETDSYVAVQLLEHYGEVSFNSLKHMAEAVQGTFTFTVLDHKSNIYFVRGNNPMCIVHFPKPGFYLYASTKEILMRVLGILKFDKLSFDEIQIQQGDILRIAADGSISCDRFNDANISNYSRFLFDDFGDYPPIPYSSNDDEYINQLLEYADYNGIDRASLEKLIGAGFDWMSIEEIIYAPDVIQEYLDMVLCDSEI